MRKLDWKMPQKNSLLKRLRNKVRQAFRKKPIILNHRDFRPSPSFSIWNRRDDISCHGLQILPRKVRYEIHTDSMETAYIIYNKMVKIDSCTRILNNNTGKVLSRNKG